MESIYCSVLAHAFMTEWIVSVSYTHLDVYKRQGVNTMTVNKAYQMLKNEGFIRTDRRLGAFVSESIAAATDFTEKLESELELLSAEACLCLLYTSGGDEFAVFIPGMLEKERAETFFDRLFSNIEHIDIAEMNGKHILLSLGAVSYTHLDVYKRQL